VGRRVSPRQLAALLLLLITILATGLRFYHLGAKGLWVDEIFTATFASPDNDWMTVARRALSTPIPSPPLWFWITHLFLKVLGDGDVVVRLPSAVAGVLGVLAIYKVGAQLFGRTTGLLSALLLAVSPAHVYFSQEARFYAAIALFSLLSLYFLHQGIHSGGKRWWVGFIVTTLVNLYIHLTAFLVLAAEVAYAATVLVYERWAARKAKRSWELSSTSALPLLASLSVIALCYLPMIPYLLIGVESPRGLGNPGPIRGFELSVRYFLLLFSTFGAGIGIPLSLYMAAFLWGLARAIRERPRQALLIFLWISVPFLVMLLLRPRHWFVSKYVISILPLYLITISWGLTDIAKAVALSTERQAAVSPRLLQALTLAGLVLIYGLMSAPRLREGYTWQQDRWLRIGRVLNHNARPEDAIAVIPLRILTMSGPELLAYYGPKPDKMDVMVVQTRAQMEEVLTNHRRVWVVVPKGWVISGNFDAQRLLPTGVPYVELSLGERASVLYMGKGQTRLTLLEEAEGFTHLPAAAYGSIAEAYRSMGLLEKALAVYARAAAQEPDRGIWRYRQAILYEQLGDPERALAAYQAAIRLEPEVSGFHAGLGDFHMRRGRPDLAIAAYRTAIALYVRQDPGGEKSPYVLAWQSALREAQEASLRNTLSSHSLEYGGFINAAKER
jgi:4-amino-4-deoxy-L-arabinose transferase-like glycosyltransferase